MGDLKDLQILVVDDSRTLRAIIKDQLNQIGIMQVSEAANGKEGLHQLRLHPDIAMIIVDWEMPVMNGLTFVRAIRAQAAFHDLYILMLTGNSGERHVLEAISSGIDDYVIKPMKPELMKKKIEHMLSKSDRFHSVKFGEYLVLHTIINSRQLEVALLVQQLLDISKLSIGSLALISGLCDPADILQKLQEALEKQDWQPSDIEQMVDGQEFWASLINREQIDKMLEVKHNNRFLIGDLLIKLGFLSPEKFDALFDSYTKERSPLR